MICRTLGGTVGISVGDTIFTSEVSKRLAKIPNLSSTGISTTGGVPSYAGLSQIQPESLRQQVLHAFTRSLATIWIVSVPLAFAGLLFALIVREYSLKRTVDRQSHGLSASEKPAQAQGTESIGKISTVVQSARPSRDLSRAPTVEA